MKIIIAPSAGFCMGVRRAVEIALDTANKKKEPTVTFGPLIHNPQATALLEEKGFAVLDRIPESGSGTVLIRAHGVPPQTKQRLKAAGFTVVDATCPRVVKVQAIIHRYARQGFSTIIIGDKNHPEIIGLLGFAQDRGHVVDSLEGLNALPAFEKAIIVAQTTQNVVFFKEVEKWAADNFPHYKIFNTICDSTQRRQSEVSRLAETVDAMIVVGGHHSGNTQRLVEIAKQSGIPVQHVETEAELDFKELESAACIGITAGASTPNWVIKRVHRALEIMLSGKTRRWRRALFSLQRAMLLTNIYVAIGAGSLCYTGIKLLGNKNYFPHVMISILYVLSMHILNNLTGTKADRFNDPERAAFYEKNQIVLAFFAIIAGASGLITAYTLGPWNFFILLIMSALGLSYNLKLLPKFFSLGKYARLKDIPGSKTILIALAWGVVTAVLPSISLSPRVGWGTVLIFIWSTGMVFVRTAFFDILDMQGDRIVGKQTIALLLGESRTLRLLKTLLLFLIALLLFASAFKFFLRFGFLLTICPVLIGVVLKAREKGHMLPGTELEFLIESHFILAGAVTLIGSLVPAL